MNNCIPDMADLSSPILANLIQSRDALTKQLQNLNSQIEELSIQAEEQNIQVEKEQIAQAKDSDTYIPSNNMFKDMNDWLKTGGVSIFFIRRIRNEQYVNEIHYVYHMCDENKSNEKGLKKMMALDLSSDPSLLGEGEWPTLIEESGIKPCTCIMKEIAINTFKGITEHKIQVFAVPRLPGIY
jgi:hypothetical protein